MCVWTWTKRCAPDAQNVPKHNHNDWFRSRELGRQSDTGRAGGKTFPDPGHEIVNCASDDCRCALLQGHSASLVIATGEAKIILQSDNEPPILDLKRQAAAECRVKHGMTVIINDTTESKQQTS